MWWQAGEPQSTPGPGEAHALLFPGLPLQELSLHAGPLGDAL